MERSRIALSESNFALPIVSRLDHMDFIMKYLERKQKMGSNGGSAVQGGGRGQPVPSDLAVKEAQSKGTLLDRVASLEHRLFQLCMEMESSSSSHPMSCTNSTQSFGGSSSSQSSQGNTSSSSLSFFNNSSLPDHGDRRTPHLHMIRTPETQEKSERMQLKSTDSSSVPEKQLVKNKSLKKKRVTASWSRIKLLGC